MFKKFFTRIAAIFLAVAIIGLSGCGGKAVDRPIGSSVLEQRLSAKPSPQGWIYYSDGNSVRRVKADGSDDQAFTDFFSSFLFVADEWVYYTDRENYPEYPDYYLSAPIIHRRTEDGLIDERISSVPASHVSYYDGYIYFTPYYGKEGYAYGTGLRRMAPDGSDEFIIYPNNINSYYFDSGYIYIKIAGDDIIRVNTDGTEPIEIIDGAEYSGLGIFDVIFDERYIYYIADLPGDHLDNKYLYRAKKDGSELTRLTKMSTDDFIVSGNYIYFIAGKDTLSNRHLYRIRIDGTGKKRIGRRKVSESRNYLSFDGIYLYVYFVTDTKYDSMSGTYDISKLFKIRCLQ